jgi:hypothetical protein
MVFIPAGQYDKAYDKIKTDALKVRVWLAAATCSPVRFASRQTRGCWVPARDTTFWPSQMKTRPPCPRRKPYCLSICHHPRLQLCERQRMRLTAECECCCNGQLPTVTEGVINCHRQSLLSKATLGQRTHGGSPPAFPVAWCRLSCRSCGK